MKHGLRRVRARRLAAGAGLVLAVAAWLVPPSLERALRDCIERAGTRHGLLARVQDVDVGFRPPLALRGLRVERRGAWVLDVESLDVALRFSGGGRIGRTWVAVGRVTLQGPAGLALHLAPSRWDVATTRERGLRAELREGGPGLAIEWDPCIKGACLELIAMGLPAGRLLAVRRRDAPLLDAGDWSGRGRIESSPEVAAFDLDLRGRRVRLAALSGDALEASAAPAFGPPTDVGLSLAGSWRPAGGTLDLSRFHLATDAATLSGSLALTSLAGDPHLQLALDAERVDLARLLAILGVDAPEALARRPAAASELGSASLSARVAGRLGDPGSFGVTQRVDFSPPRRPLPALERLRGDFVHDVVPAGGSRRSIEMSSGSPDFIALNDVPPLFVRALLLGEDAGFFGHHGLDLSAIPHALLTNLARGGASRGASTITQQLAKNLFLSRERRLARKLQEFCLALLLEATLGKQRILEIYLNVIEWGPDTYGLRPAARRYFRKEPRDLTPKQMAFLVALIPGPLKYQRSFADGTPSPGFRPLIANLLAKLRSLDGLSEEQYQAALAEELGVGLEP